jgi:predicted RNase H-like nuclease (RuvC/YqgF family)
VKIFRGPKTTDSWQETDTKSVEEWMRDWQPGNKLRFDGTIDKSGERHTDLGVEVSEQDIISLHAGLVKYYKSYLRNLEQERDQLQASVNKLEEVLEKISYLVSNKKDRAPNADELLNAIEEVADHFRWSFKREKPYKSRFEWLKWKSL